MAATTPRPAWNSFVKIFNDIARHHHRYEVFRDFVTLAAISVHNAIVKDPTLEAEYLQIIGRYSKEDALGFARLLGELVILLDPEPYDVLGRLYMELELGSNHTGQFFTPPELSELMARLNSGEELANLKRPFVTLQEPACGAGGMVLAFVKVMLSHGHNPAERMWAHCQDVDRLAALMCYLQLSLWHVPAVVVVGNTLAHEAREVFYTPAHYLGFWDSKLRRRHEEEEKDAGEKGRVEPALEGAPAPVAAPAAEIAPPVPAASLTPKAEPARSPAFGGQEQFDFGF